jgi:hypothetical protein
MHKLDALEDGKLQILAAVALLNNSKLVQWNDGSNRFETTTENEFEAHWRSTIDPKFGRLICWMQFSAGIEFWLKGMCLVHNVDFRTFDQVPCYPELEPDAWAQEFLKDWSFGGTMTVTKYGTLGSLTHKPKGGTRAPLDGLLLAAKAREEDALLIRASCSLLARSIRNRDAHAYVPNVRGDHHGTVAPIFSRVLNTTVTWLPDGPRTLTEWLKCARSSLL